MNDLELIAAKLVAFDERLKSHDKHVELIVANAVDKAVTQMKSSLLSDEERAWVKLALEAQSQRVKLRQAIIDKTLTALVWSALAWIGIVLLEYAKSHGMWKP